MANEEEARNGRQLKGLKWKTQKALDGEGKDSLITESDEGKTIVNLGTDKELFSEGSDGKTIIVSDGAIMSADEDGNEAQIVAIPYGGPATGYMPEASEKSISIGTSADGDESTYVGLNISDNDETQAVAIGYGVKLMGGDGLIAIGYGATVGGADGPVAIGYKASAETGDSAVAVGSYAEAGDSAVAVGSYAEAGDSAVAVGWFSKAPIPQTVSFDGDDPEVIRTVVLGTPDNIFFRNEYPSLNYTTLSQYADGQTLTEWVDEKIAAKIPETPTADGTYTLKTTVSGSQVTYNWVLSE